MKRARERSQTQKPLRRWVKRLVPLALMMGVVGASLGGCGAMIADLPLVGLPADAPPRKDHGGFLPVNDLPGKRETQVIETPEQAKIRAELAASRDRQETAAKAMAK